MPEIEYNPQTNTLSRIPTREEYAQARRVVLSRAHDAHDARALLMMLGLMPDERAD